MIAAIAGIVASGNTGNNPVLIAHAGASGGGSEATTGGVTTSGATLIVISASWLNNTSASVTISDSRGNTWTPLTARVSANVTTQLYYCYAPSVGINHNFTVAGSLTFPSIQIQAWGRMTISSPFDVENGGGSTSSATVSTNSITPSQNSALIIAGLSDNANSVPSTVSINNNFNISDTTPASASVIGGSMAYKIIRSGLPTSATWTTSQTNAEAAASIAAFKF